MKRYSVGQCPTGAPVRAACGKSPCSLCMPPSPYAMHLGCDKKWQLRCFPMAKRLTTSEQLRDPGP